MTAVLVYITASDHAEAEKIGRLLLEEKLAACVNIVDGMRSMFWWEGALEQGHETILLAKTKPSLLDELTAKVKAVHSYDLPCIVALPIVGGNQDFIDWISSETK
jgi:periplasmic divalent cation tolerance protein